METFRKDVSSMGACPTVSSKIIRQMINFGSSIRQLFHAFLLYDLLNLYKGPEGLIFTFTKPLIPVVGPNCLF